MADVVINTIYEFIDFVLGTNRGTSDNILDVELRSDLDFNDITDINYLQYKTQFNGLANITWYINFDGGGHKISNISFSGNSATWSMFNKLSGGLYNLTLHNVNIVCDNFRIVGDTAETINCHINGKVVCQGTFYGINPIYWTRTIESCSVNCEVVCTTFYGISAGGEIKRCCVSGNVKANNVYLISYNYSYTHCYSCWVKDIILRNKDNTGIPTNITFCSSTVYTSYAVIANAADFQTAGYTNQHFFPATVGSFYVNDEWTGGNCGTSSTNLKSKSWLREQGWSI